MEGLLIRDLILPVSGTTSTLARGATLASRWLHDPHPISNHLVGLGFPHPAGLYLPDGFEFSAQVSWSCRGLAGFLIRGWELILPAFGGTSALARGATLTARWLHEHQPISNQLVGRGLYTARGGIDPADLCFRSRVVGVVEIWMDF